MKSEAVNQGRESAGSVGNFAAVKTCFWKANNAYAWVIDLNESKKYSCLISYRQIQTVSLKRKLQSHIRFLKP